MTETRSTSPEERVGVRTIRGKTTSQNTRRTLRDRGLNAYQSSMSIDGSGRLHKSLKGLVYLGIIYFINDTGK